MSMGQQDRLAGARLLLERCGIPTEGLSRDEVIQQADDVSQAVSDYLGGREYTSDIADMLDEHLADEFQRRDADATMTTMVAEPYLDHVPVMTGGVGYDEVYRFYKRHFIPKWPSDTQALRVSRTVGDEQVVDELVMSFTHDREMDFMLPGVAPTGRRVELPVVVVAKFEGGKLAHEHIYWDQAALLVQVGLLDRTRLPVTGAEQAHKLLDKTLPTNTLMQAWGRGR